jgi:hypothetical protein
MGGDKNLFIKKTFALAIQNHQKNNLQIAEKLYKKILKLKPNHPNAYNNLGIILQQTGQYHEAKNCYEKAIELNPSYVKALNNLGTIFQELGEISDAINSYKKAVNIKPDHIISIYNLGVVLFTNKQYKNALEQFKLINFKDSKSFQLSCLYNLNDEYSFFKKLDDQIKQGEINALIGSLSLRSEIKYGVKSPNPFCGDPLKFVLNKNLTEQYDFENVFTKPIKNLLKKKIFSSVQQDLLINGHQTAGNLFSEKNDFLDKIKNIIYFEVKKYQNHFKESKEGFIKNWPKSYSINAWLVNMKSGGKLHPHMHEHGWISGSIYINIPPKLKTDSGNLVVCIDDREHAVQTGQKLKKSIDVITGSLCLFPSSLFHYTIPFESKEERIVLAFDMIPD